MQCSATRPSVLWQVVNDFEVQLFLETLEEETQLRRRKAAGGWAGQWDGFGREVTLLCRVAFRQWACEWGDGVGRLLRAPTDVR